jgi:hypothetical protein
MREISCFPPPDSHVSLSAVLEPCPNPQPAPPPRTAPATKQLTPKPWSAAPETNPDRHTSTPRPTTAAHRTTNLVAGPSRHPNRCEFESWPAASKALTRFEHQPTAPIGHDTRPSRLESTQSATPPEPTTCERKPNRLRKLFPPRAPASAPTRHSTSKVPNRPGQHCDAETATPAVPKSSPRPYPANDLNIAQPSRTPPGHWNR